MKQHTRLLNIYLDIFSNLSDMSNIASLGACSNVALFCTQAVLRLRKRVTLMVVSVSAIFVISWGGDTVLHILEDSSFKLSPLAIPIAHVVVMFNAAVNPFACALINERFRQKMKEMFDSGSRSLAAKTFVTSERKPQGIQMENMLVKQNNDHPQ